MSELLEAVSVQEVTDTVVPAGIPLPGVLRGEVELEIPENIILGEE